MDFIVDNYLWFIVGGIVLLLALIGYIAEKTDFGRKDATKTPKKEKEEKIVASTPDAEPVAPVVPDADNLVLGQDTSLDNAENDQTEQDLVNLNVDEDLTVPLEPVAEENQNEEINTINEDLTVPLVPEEDTEKQPAVDVSPVDDVSPADDSIFEPLVKENKEEEKPVEAGIEEVVEEEPVKTEENTENVEVNEEKKKEDVDLPNIDNLNNKDSDDDDVWRF